MRRFAPFATFARSIALTVAPLFVAACSGAFNNGQAAPTAPPSPTTESAAAAPAPSPGAQAQVPMRKKGENLLAGATLYVDNEHQVRKLANTLKTKNPAQAKAIEKIADQPTVEWLGPWVANIEWFAKARTAKINEAGALPTYLVYNIPNRDCGQYSKGGIKGPEEYKAWITKLANGIGKQRAVVFLEPDSLGQLKQCLSPADQKARLDMLQFAVHTLEANGNTAVYLDAGNPHWMPAAEMASRLKAAGIDEADGFSLNVSNYMTTEENLKYGKEISPLVGGKHFVIDTSRNGNGPTPDFDWCNPRGRALGQKPTTHTGDPLVDAYLWLKRPGESDGDCKGAPKAGEFWLEVAVELSNNAKW